jgi:PTH1 family peptidyl-tRNA hydrolase
LADRADTPDAEIRAIVGLGNPGERYERTRHNAGFLVLESLRTGGAWRRRALREEDGVELAGRRVLLMRPLTYMNRSGRAVLEMTEEHGFAPAEILVVADDVSLPWGRLRVRRAGGTGGHRGLESIAESLQTSGFPRLRIGVDGPPEDMALEDFVLAPLEGEPWEELRTIVTRATAAARVICDEGLEEAMNRFNASQRSSGKRTSREGEDRDDG